ncbi:hypothetical protein [Paraburkholderia sediminicola]|uniref:hypothetical protein n=1 Tax=Paraburkholderia sediminicola TaxID=458836 RepID=UPI0038B7F0D9
MIKVVLGHKMKTTAQGATDILPEVVSRKTPAAGGTGIKAIPAAPFSITKASSSKSEGEKCANNVDLNLTLNSVHARR